MRQECPSLVMANETNDNIKDLGSSKTEGLAQLAPSRNRRWFTNNGLLNEEGLPIIDITEPIPPSSEMQDVPSYFHESDLIPLHMLSPAERDRRRRERDRIFDLLEEEERLQQLREQREEEEKTREEVRKRKEEAKAEYERVQRQKELHRKMGKALLGAATDIKEKDGGLEETPVRRKDAAPRKNVTFAEMVDSGTTISGKGEAPSATQADWADVAVGRLRSSHRVPLISTVSADRYPMKMQVIERRGPNAAAQSSGHITDSDDESPSSVDVPQQLSEALDDKEHDQFKQDTGSDRDESLEEEPLDDEFDWDSVQHQREIAFEYFTKRHVIGAQAARVMAAYNGEDDESGHDGAHVSPQVSRFRAGRMSEAYDKSHSPTPACLESSVVPEARQKSIRNAIRVGKLENNQLVGGPSGDSGSEDDDVREMIELLKKGNVQNVGPNFDPTSMSRRHTSEGVSARPTAPPAATLKLPTPNLPPGDAVNPAHLPRQVSAHSTSPKSAVGGVIERKPPRPPPSQAFPLQKPSRQPTAGARSAVIQPPSDADSFSAPANPVFSSIVESPSYPAPSMIVESPSFPRPQATQQRARHSSRPDRPPVVVASTSSNEPAPNSNAVDPGATQRKVSRFMAERQS
ncbi:hypothetical protein ID866_3883 [Astraeus odoratus]|nr:hypothetical protein ID866_3883 [Astraeus odoratus]